MILNLLIINLNSSESFKELVNYLKNSETEIFYCDYDNCINENTYLLMKYLNENKLNNVQNVLFFNYYQKKSNVNNNYKNVDIGNI